MHLYFLLLLSGPCGGNDMQMPHSVSENSTVISTNAVKKQTRGARDCSGFPEWLCCRCWYCCGWKKWGERERGGGCMAHKTEGKEQKRKGEGDEMSQDPTFQMRTIIKLIAWQGESRITMLHWQTCSIISRVPSVSSCTEESSLRLFNFAPWHNTVCEAQQQLSTQRSHVETQQGH